MVNILAYILSVNKNLKLLNFDALGKLKGFKLLAHNIRSLLPKLHQYIWEIQNSKIDVICLSETWLRPEIENTLITIPSYTNFRLDRESADGNRPKPGGGLCTYVKDGILVKVLSQHNLTNADIEMQVLEICNDTCRNMVIINIYRPPSGNQHNAIEAIRSTYFNLVDLHDKLDIVILGDVNINMLEENPSRKLLLDFCNEATLSCDILIPTRETSKSSTCLDIILSSITHNMSSGIIQNSISDHYPNF